MNRTISKVLKDLRTLPDFVVTEQDEYGVFGKCRGYYVNAYRATENSVVSEYRVIIRFAVAKDFDRWANSTNFTDERSYESKHFRSDLLKQYKWMNKVVRTKLFNWDSYFSPIRIPSVGLKK